jgi:hypothetical protein
MKVYTGTYGVPVSSNQDKLVLMSEKVLAGVDADDVAALTHLHSILPVLYQSYSVP